MIAVECASLFQLGARGGEVSLSGEGLRLADELVDERRRLHPLARRIVDDARLVVREVVAQQLRRQVVRALEITCGERGARLFQRAGFLGHEGIDVDRRAGVLRFLQQLLRRIEHRIHAQDEAAALYDLIDPALLVERDGLLERREDAVFHRRRRAMHCRGTLPCVVWAPRKSEAIILSRPTVTPIKEGASMDIIATSDAPKAIGPYSQAIKAGNVLYTSGQIALDPATGSLVEGDFAAQARRVFENLKAVLAAAGTGFGSVVKATVYLTDLANFATLNEIYALVLRRFQTRADHGRRRAIAEGGLVEIDLVAILYVG